MVTKTFKSDSTLQTLQLVQNELGADAIVVSMREVPQGPLWNPWKKSAVEVVAAAKPREEARPAPKQSMVEFVEEIPEIEWDFAPVKKPVKLPPPLKLNLAPLSGSSAPSVATRSTPEAESDVPHAKQDGRYLPPALKKIQEQLIQQGVENYLIEGLLNVALETLSPSTLADMEACKKSIVQLMGAELRVQKGAGTFVSSNVLCLVGASGSGKTSSTAKLALFFRQNLKKNVIWVCADTVRTGAVAEARAYTDALGVELKLVYTPQDLKEVLSAPQSNDLFLVDTPGYNPCSESQMAELGALLSEMPGRSTCLVAPAITKEADLLQLSASLGLFKLDALILTKLDETHTFGGIYNFARRNQIPLAYFAIGREAAHHLETADPVRLVSALFGKEWNK
jgi:flagellar biosynthesis protein FlhF